jgi:hypothetical protein
VDKRRKEAMLQGLMIEEEEEEERERERGSKERRRRRGPSGGEEKERREREEKRKGLKKEIEMKSYLIEVKHRRSFLFCPLIDVKKEAGGKKEEPPFLLFLHPSTVDSGASTPGIVGGEACASFFCGSVKTNIYIWAQTMSPSLPSFLFLADRSQKGSTPITNIVRSYFSHI